MQSVADRRTFVRHMVVGLPVIAGTTSLPRSLHGFPLHESPSMSTPVEGLLRQLARLHNDMSRRGFTTPDDVQALATHTRLLAAERLSANRDMALVRGIRQVVAREGRDAVINHRSDPDMMRQELVAVGFDLRTTPPPIVDDARRGDALDRLARGGLAPAYFDTMAELEGYQVMLMMAASTGFCPALKDMERMLESMTTVLCVLAIMLPPSAPDCFAASSVLATLKLISLFAGC